MVRYIALHSGKQAIVDDGDYDSVAPHHWGAAGWRGRYVGRHIVRDGRRTTVYLHRLLLQAPAELEVDHINRNPLDNRRANLRLVSHNENERNKEVKAQCISGVRGVEFNRTFTKPFRAVIYRNRRRVFSKTFRTLDEAVAALAEARRILGVVDADTLAVQS